MNDSATSHPAGRQVGLTAWSAPNPFGEPTAYLLAHPLDGAPEDVLAEAITHLDLKRIDRDGDILPIGSDTPAEEADRLATPEGVVSAAPRHDHAVSTGGRFNRSRRGDERHRASLLADLATAIVTALHTRVRSELGRDRVETTHP